MSIKSKGFTTGSGGAGSDTLDDVTTRGATTSNSVQVGGLNIAGNYALPTADGSASQVLQTDGNGAISFQTLDVTGGLQYKGTIAVSAFSTTLASALTGDFYKISTGGTAGDGRTYAAGDSIIINADMGGTFADSKIDKIDNTEIISSVNGQTGPVNIYADDSVLNLTGTGLSVSGSGSGSQLNADSASSSAAGIIEIADVSEVQAGTANDRAIVPSLLSSIGLSQLNNDAGFITSSGNQITEVASKVADFTASSNAVYLVSNGITVTLPTASLSDGDVIGIFTNSADKSVTVSGSAVNMSNQYVSSITLPVSKRGIVFFFYDTAVNRWRQTSNTPGTAAASATTDFQSANARLTDVAGLTPADGAFIVGDGNNFVAESGATARTSLGAQEANARLTDVAGLTPADGAFIVGDGNNFVAESGATARTSLGLATVASSGEYADLNNKPTVPSTISTLTDVTITNVQNNDVLQYDSTSGEWENAQISSGGATSLNGLSDVTISTPATGNLLERNGAGQFVNVVKSTINVGDFNDDNTYQPKDAQLTDIAGLTPADGAFIVGDGNNFVAESGATARTSLGLAIGTDVQAFDAQLSDVAGLTPSDGAFIVGDGNNFVAESGATARTSLGLATVASSGEYADLNNKPTVPTTINTLTDVTITSVQDNDVLQYDSASSLWKNAQISSGGATSLNGLSDVTISTPATGNLLERNGAGQFVNVAKSTINVGDFNDDNTYQPKDAQLSDVAGLTPSDGAFIVGDGNNFVAESGATARTSLGLAIGTDVQAFDAQLSDVAGLTPADGAFIVGDGNNFVAESGATARTSLGAIAELSEDSSPQLGADLDVNGYDISTASGNAKIGLKPHGTGFTELIGNTTGGNNPGSLRFNCEQNTHGVILKSPLHNDYAAGGDYTLTLPTGLPASDKVLQSSSTGVLSWVAQSGGGGASWTYSAITGNTTAQASYHYSCTGTLTLTLPAVAGVTAGSEIRVKNMGTGDVTVDGNSSETIDGQATFVMSIQYESITLVCTGSAWEIV